MRASPSAYPTLSPGTKSPSHLVLRNGTWHFRMAVPIPCRPRLGGLSEFKASLRTGGTVRPSYWQENLRLTLTSSI